MQYSGGLSVNNFDRALIIDPRDSVSIVATDLSMRSHRVLRGPLDEQHFFIFGETRGVIERRVVSRWHRTAIDGGFYVLQCFRLFLRVVTLPIGEIQHSARRVGSKVCRRHCRIPRSTAAGRMALVT